jgi:ribosomal protein S18 acetylase RimI-like enzyme
MQVRQAGPDDVPALARLNAEVQDLHRAARPQDYLDPALAEIEGWMRRLLADPTVVLLLAEEQTDALGFAVVRRVAQPGHVFAPPRQRALVDGLGVAARSRRRGVGRALMAAAEAQGRAWGVATVALDVQGFNADAEAFYRALGYEVASRRMCKPV